MEIEQNVWGFTEEGEAVLIYTMRNPYGAEVKLTNIGASIVSVVVPDRERNMADVVLGYADFRSYYNDGAAMGKTVGRYANRIGSGRFTLDGTEYRLPLNSGRHHLHGGPVGFAEKLWESRVEDEQVIFSLVSPDGDQGYPGELGAEIRYGWSDDNTLSITLLAACSAPTVVNLTNHTYFNLGGHTSGSVLGHELSLDAGRFLATTPDQIPTGQFEKVNGTPMDFRLAKALGQDIDSDFEPLRTGSGYDHCWVVDGYGYGLLTEAGELFDPVTGRYMKIRTTQPGVQVYTGNFLQGGARNKSGGYYDNRDGVAIECQGFPDAPNHPDFPSQVLRPGETYQHVIEYIFGVR